MFSQCTHCDPTEKREERENVYGYVSSGMEIVGERVWYKSFCPLCLGIFSEKVKQVKGDSVRCHGMFGREGLSTHARPLAMRYHKNAGEEEEVLCLLYYPVGEAGKSYLSIFTIYLLIFTYVTDAQLQLLVDSFFESRHFPVPLQILVLSKVSGTQ